MTFNLHKCRSQLPRGLRYKMSSPAQTLGSWVQIPLDAWMSVRISCVFVLSGVCSSLRQGCSLIKESYQLSMRSLVQY
jgi:hypothetical protein